MDISLNSIDLTIFKIGGLKMQLRTIRLSSIQEISFASTLKIHSHNILNGTINLHKFIENKVEYPLNFKMSYNS